MEVNPLTALDDHLASRLLEQRTLLLGTPLDETVGNRLCAALILLATEDPAVDALVAHLESLGAPETNGPQSAEGAQE